MTAATALSTTTIEVTFSEPVQSAEVATATNYWDDATGANLECGATDLTVTAGSLTSATTAQLTVTGSPAGGSSCSVVVRNVKDLNSNVVDVSNDSANFTYPATDTIAPTNTETAEQINSSEPEPSILLFLRSEGF